MLDDFLQLRALPHRCLEETGQQAAEGCAGRLLADQQAAAHEDLLRRQRIRLRKRQAEIDQTTDRLFEIHQAHLATHRLSKLVRCGHAEILAEQPENALLELVVLRGLEVGQQRGHFLAVEEVVEVFGVGADLGRRRGTWLAKKRQVLRLECKVSSVRPASPAESRRAMKVVRE